MMKERRNRKQIKQDFRAECGSMVRQGVDKTAYENFKRPAYQIDGGVLNESRK